MDVSQEASDVVVERARSLDEWTAVIRQRFVALQIAQHTAADMSGVVRTRHLGHLQASAVVSAPQTFTRTKRLASDAGEGELLALGLVDRGTGHLQQDGRTCAVAGGSFALYETSRPFSWSLSGDWRIFVVTWPRESVAFSDAELRRLLASAVPGNAGVGRLVSPMLRGLVRDDPGISPAGAARFASEIAELSLIAAGETRREPAEVDAGRDRLREIQVFIEQHLVDPALTPPRIAQEFYMSARTLHRLFAQHGLTVTAWIKDRRLEAARRALSAPGSGQTPVGEIATRHGFSTAAYFSREFTARYGQSPRSYRSQARL
jgi:AraC-like DNA-binding protein